MIRKFIEKLFWKYHQEDLKDVSFEEGKFDEIMNTFRGNEDCIEMIKILARTDKENVFRAIGNDKLQILLKGQYVRTLFLLRQARKKKEEAKVGTPSKVGGRYG